MPKGIPITEEELNQRRHQICNIATQLFYEKGFIETSMREISEAAGVGKSTLYDYFKNKEDILVFFFQDELQILISAANQIFQQQLSAQEKLRQMMQAHLDFILANRNFYLRLSMETPRLGKESQVHVQNFRHIYQDMICKLIEDGIREGCFRPVNPVMTMRILLTTMTPVVFTTRPSGTPQEMLADSLDIIFKGILR